MEGGRLGLFVPKLRVEVTRYPCALSRNVPSSLNHLKIFSSSSISSPFSTSSMSDHLQGTFPSVTRNPLGRTNRKIKRMTKGKQAIQEISVGDRWYNWWAIWISVSLIAYLFHYLIVAGGEFFLGAIKPLQTATLNRQLPSSPLSTEMRWMTPIWIRLWSPCNHKFWWNRPCFSLLLLLKGK